MGTGGSVGDGEGGCLGLAGGGGPGQEEGGVPRVVTPLRRTPAPPKDKPDLEDR